MYSSWLAAGVSIGPGEGHQSVDIGHELYPWQSSDRKQLILLPWGAVVNIPYKAVIDNCLLLPLFLVSCVSCLRVPDFLLGLGNGRKKTNVDASKKVSQDLKYHRVNATSTSNWHCTKFSSTHSSSFLGHIMQHACSCYNIWVSPISYEAEPGGGRYRSPAHKLDRQLGARIRSSRSPFGSLLPRTWAPNFLTLDLPMISRIFSQR